MVRRDMRGTELHPLNTLKEKHPELYVRYSKKYEGREEVMENFIPTLNAAWNDALHFTPIHPLELKKALTDAGMEPHEMKFYEVDPALLDPSRTTVYLYEDVDAKGAPNTEGFVSYDPEKIHEYAIFPEATKKYYRESFAAGKRPLLFVGVPHILHTGSLDISNLPVITV